MKEFRPRVGDLTGYGGFCDVGLAGIGVCSGLGFWRQSYSTRGPSTNTRVVFNLARLRLRIRAYFHLSNR